MIKQKYIDLVKDRVDLVTLIGDLCPGTKFKKAGQNKCRCLCPLHDEHTPSFNVNITTNRYKCYGCGKYGDVFKFVQELNGVDFNEAVHTLIDMYCGEVDKHDLYEKHDEKSEEERKKMETMYIYNEYAFEFFRSKYDEDNDEAVACRAYAEKSEESEKGRWDSDFCKTYGLGFAPSRGNQFVSFAKKKGLNLSICAELGLIKEDESHPGNYFDFYRGRLVIPQRDRYNRIITFTARALSPQATIKYLNANNSLIYTKSQSVFGIDVAMRAARAEGKIYLVEGAPDVLKLQSLGIANAVSPLGGDWTEDQLKMFSSFGCRICIIPDCDEIKEKEKFCPGDKNAFRNGALAVRMGFQVTVKEIPREGEKKQDPDSYITSRKKLDSMIEKDFIVWYMSKHHDPDMGDDAMLALMGEVCDMLVHVPTEVQQTTILNELKDKYKKPSLWRSSMLDAGRRLKEHKKRQALRKANELDGFRFFRKDNHYYDIDQQGREREWTNFVLKPLFLIIDEEKPTRIFELENDKGEKKTLELLQCDVTKLERFKEKIEGRGDFRFFEKQEKYEMLKAFMYDKTAEAQRVNLMGWNNIGNKGFYAFCNGIVYEGRWQAVDEYGMIRLGEEIFYLPAMSKLHQRSKKGYQNEKRFMHEPKKMVTMKDYFTLLTQCYGDNAIVAILFYLATLYRDIIVGSSRSFPILNIYGQKESGKTEFALCLMYLFKRNFTPDNLTNTTFYAMGDMCAEVCNMLVHFDEYKNSLSARHVDFLKGIYDSSGRTKRANESDRRESTNVECGVILTGQEMPTVDVALFSRLIFLETHNNKHSREDTDRFHQLLKLRNSYPTNITVDLIKYRDNFNAGWKKAWERAITDVKQNVNYNTIGERFINNWAIMLATYYTVKPFLEDLPFDEEKIMTVCIEGLKYQHSLCNTTDEIATFWSMFSKARQLGDIKEGQDYKISITTKIKVSTKKEQCKNIEFSQPTTLLYIREKICMAKANIQAKREGKTMIPDDSLLSYLKSSIDFFGKTKSPLKFFIYDDNGEKKKQSGETLYDQERVLVFDYNSICSNYDINLRTFTENKENTNNTCNADNTSNTSVEDYESTD